MSERLIEYMPVHRAVDRQHEVLQALGHLRYLSGDTLQALFFADLTRRTMQRMLRQGSS